MEPPGRAPKSFPYVIALLMVAAGTLNVIGKACALPASVPRWEDRSACPYTTPARSRAQSREGYVHVPPCSPRGGMAQA
jgi:hypothetical protein